MDTRVVKKKLGLKERYAAMTRGLPGRPPTSRWTRCSRTTRYEGIKIHDWDKWEDPFRLTMDAYWKYQGEKERSSTP
jgi:phenol/toluene 2-monooxygenase (NADH) P3/A3